MAVNLSTTSKKIDTILVLDFGSQYTQLIARRVRESNVYSEILPWDIDEEKIKYINPKGIILSGGPDSVTNSYTPRVPQIVFELNIPILGICYGMQTLAEQLGGQVISSEQKEFGYSELTITADCILFSNLGKTLNVWMSHGDQVQDLPDNFELVAETATAPIAVTKARCTSYSCRECQAPPNPHNGSLGHQSHHAPTDGLRCTEARFLKSHRQPNSH